MSIGTILSTHMHTHTHTHTHTQSTYMHTHTHSTYMHTHTQTEAPVHTGTAQNLIYTQNGQQRLETGDKLWPWLLGKKTGAQTHPLPLVYHESSQDSPSLHLLAVWLPWRCDPSNPEGTPLTPHSADLSPKKYFQKQGTGTNEHLSIKTKTPDTQICVTACVNTKTFGERYFSCAGLSV